MPSVGGPTDRDRGTPRPDIVLGDRFGASCEPAVVAAAERIFGDLGFSVRRNEPYAGAFTTAHYGQPSRRVHAIQIEVNRRLYMNEATVAALARSPRAQAQDEPLHRRHGDGVPRARRDALSLAPAG